MPGIIELLPDAVANQIAAGEVIQRPASAVKELLENAIDAGATKIRLVVKDAGKTLIQVMDNGCGMNETDARLCFERHATSKIKKAEDLFNIHTKGFRGEALASIAAVAQVEVKTKRAEDSLGTALEVENSRIKSQEPTACADGTLFSMKNLFFNVPARRNFLKSDQVELRHIIEEFERVALVHPEIDFSLNHNGDEIFQLPVSGLKQRIVNFFGKSFNERLVPVEVETDIVKITGYVIKPDFAKKSRGDQFFFVNKRFIRSAYLHHAVQMAFDNLIQKEYHAGYFLYMEVPPSSIDVNIHPTKTEVKFEDERSIYMMLQSAVRQALGKYNISPTLDFNTDPTFDIAPATRHQPIVEPKITINPDYNPFKENTPAKNFTFNNNKPKSDFYEWKGNGNSTHEDFFEKTESPVQAEMHQAEAETTFGAHKLLFGKYILVQTEQSCLLIDIKRARERILFHQLMEAMQTSGVMIQQTMFPEHVELSPADFAFYQEIKEEMKLAGFELSYAGDNTLQITGTPVDLDDNLNSVEMITEMLEKAKHSSKVDTNTVKEKLAAAMSARAGKNAQTLLKKEEMDRLVSDLFNTALPAHTPGGKPVFVTLTLEEIERRFKI